MVKEKFKTKLLASVFLGVFFTAYPAIAFFVGNIEIKSKFGEKFEAFFKIHLDNNEGYDVSLGEAGDYEKMGLTRSPLVNSLVLEKPPAATGATRVIRVFSKIPLFFPSFNLVIKAKHNGGTLLKNSLVTVNFQKGLALNAFGEKKTKPSVSPVKTTIIKNEILINKKKVVPPTLQNDLFLKDKGMSLTLKPEPEKTSEGKKVAIKPTPIINRLRDRRRLSGTIWAVPKKIFPVTKLGKMEGPLVSRSRLIQLNNGEGLFSVARKIKIKEIHPSQIEVALWMKNIEKFIYGNINGIKAGTQLEVEGIGNLAENIDLETVKIILTGQAKEWKIIREKVGEVKETKTAIREVPLPVERVEQVGTIFDWVEEWKSSWEKNDIDSHISFYHADSTIKESQNFRIERSTVERKKKLLSKYPNPNLKLSIQNLISKPGGSWVVFEQHFFSKVMKSRGTKEIRVKLINGNWKIEEEEFYAEKNGVTKSIQRGNYKTGNSRPFVIHVSSHSRETEAISFSNKLRKNGYDAYFAPIRISKSANIYRVYIGRFATWDQARRIIKILRENNVAGHATVIPYPLTLRVGEVGSILEARQVLKNLRLNGLSGLLSVSNSGSSRGIQFGVYVGAFKKPENAVWLMKRLNEAGFNYKRIRP